MGNTNKDTVKLRSNTYTLSEMSVKDLTLLRGALVSSANDIYRQIQTFDIAPNNKWKRRAEVAREIKLNDIKKIDNVLSERQAAEAMLEAIPEDVVDKVLSKTGDWHE